MDGIDRQIRRTDVQKNRQDTYIIKTERRTDGRTHRGDRQTYRHRQTDTMIHADGRNGQTHAQK